MQTHRDTDSKAPATPQFSCTCGSTFSTSGQLLSHAMTCQRLLADEDHE